MCPHQDDYYKKLKLKLNVYKYLLYINKNVKLSPADLSPASMFIVVPVLNRFV